ncbi:adenine nucleotide alpha hydrolases-like protein [Rhizoclosmatium globosum]|uniref:Adenine nucleotide alpha hydrolases-like protein n=1 Tax=Rhizoclosmatium globosum TaxID=329046 RepID=A0A1Y2CYP9_9FUNG|nr:adenine nucleotide alpha hydrolases-like protein [Rhizoclosmatium globosum]|eukprot:ORY51954.1 adenine nucleotide alpha hydrolases-like protein [Rhizoclosmatium globosum]
MIVNESQQSTETTSKPLGRTVSSTQVTEKFVIPVIQEEVYQPHKDTPKRVICVAVDDSPQSQYALTWTLDHLASANDQVCILNVRPYAIPGYVLGSSFTGTAEGLERYNRDLSHDLLKKYGDQVLARGVQCRAIALRGDPREEILAKVNVLKPDMLVTGCRGLGFLQKAFKGSLSDYLVQHAECVVVVPKMNS